MRFFIAIFLSAGLFTGTVSAQEAKSAAELPKVFVLGENEAAYDELVKSYETSLLDACDCTMKDAFAKWLEMLHELEVYSDKQNFDIRGVKAWLHVFWKADGTVDHIAYHLRPNSRAVDNAAMSEVLAGFAGTYSFPLIAKTGYAHYSTGEFPVFGELSSASPEKANRG